MPPARTRGLPRSPPRRRASAPPRLRDARRAGRRSPASTISASRSLAASKLASPGREATQAASRSTTRRPEAVPTRSRAATAISLSRGPDRARSIPRRARREMKFSAPRAGRSAVPASRSPTRASARSASACGAAPETKRTVRNPEPSGPRRTSVRRCADRESAARSYAVRLVRAQGRSRSARGRAGCPSYRHRSPRARARCRGRLPLGLPASPQRRCRASRAPRRPVPWHGQPESAEPKPGRGRPAVRGDDNRRVSCSSSSPGTAPDRL